MIEVEHLSKNYGGTVAVDDISFDAQPGDILGFLGPNGSGKTTTMRIITGYLPPSSGGAKVAGFDVALQSFDVRKNIGYLPERVPLYHDMIVRDYLKFMHELKQYPRASRKAGIELALERCDLIDVQQRIIGNLSRGYKQRVGLAQAILGDPKVLVLDEPTVGLDPAQLSGIREMIRSFAQDRTIILSTHILQEVSIMCNKVVVIKRGRIVLDSYLENLNVDADGVSKLRLFTGGKTDGLEKALKEINGVLEVESINKESDEHEWLISGRKDLDIRERVAETVARGDWKLLGLRPSTPTLEELFLRVTSDDGERESA